MPLYFFSTLFLVQVEAQKKKPSKSLYARATDTGVDPRVAARRLNIDWDTAAEIEEDDVKDETEVPAAVVCYHTFLLKTCDCFYFENTGINKRACSTVFHCQFCNKYTETRLSQDECKNYIT